MACGRGGERLGLLLWVQRVVVVLPSVRTTSLTGVGEGEERIPKSRSVRLLADAAFLPRSFSRRFSSS